MALKIKTCSACNCNKPIDQFGICSGYRDGHRGQCNQCRTAKQTERLRENPDKRRTTAQSRAQSLRQRYGLTVEQYRALHSMQQDRCAICGIVSKKLHVDHCHKTGQVRGLLCFDCNLALGRVGDSLEGIRRFVQYLEATSAA